MRTLVSPSPLTTDIDVLLDKPEWQGLTKDTVYHLGAQYIVDAITCDHEDRFQFAPSSSGYMDHSGPQDIASFLGIDPANQLVRRREAFDCC